MNKPDGGPAFPQPEIHDNCEPFRHIQAEVGISIRDYFASKAMMKFYSLTGEGSFANIAKLSYGLADAMLIERAK